MNTTKQLVIGCALTVAFGFAPRAESTQSMTYTYDANGRLTGVTYDGSLTTLYRYDPNGNLVLLVTGATPVGVDGADAPVLPATYALRGSHPNPFRSTGVIPYELPSESRVRLEVFDVSGRRVRTLIDETQAPGFYQAVWDGRDDRGRRVASGVYCTRLAAGAFVGTERMTIMR